MNAPTLRLVGIGECLVELCGDGNGGYKLSYAGDVFNSCYYYAALAPKAAGATFVSAIGDDSFSAGLLTRYGSGLLELDCSVQSGATLGLYLIDVDSTGERHFSYWRSAAPARHLVRRLTETQRASIAEAGLVLVSGVTLAILDVEQRETLAEMLQARRQNGGRIAFDPNYRRALWESPDAARVWTDRFYRLSDIALAGLEDERGLFGVSTPEEVLARQPIAQVPEVLVKAGEQGVVGRVGGIEFKVPADHVSRVVDTTAAGDAFNAAYLAARGAGVSANRSAVYAARVAAIVISHRGAIVPYEYLPTLSAEPASL
jgi:2-dehydro-3-deoxygluconokinase